MSTSKFGCLMAVVPSGLAQRVVAWGRANVPDLYLGKGGRELDTHVTVLYGFDDPIDTSVLGSMLLRHGPMDLRIKGVSLFPDTGDGEVLKLDVECKELRDLHALLKRTFPCPGNRFPDYQPHLTVAYLDPGILAFGLCVDEPDFVGETFTVEQCVYSSKDKKKTLLPLQWQEGQYALISVPEVLAFAPLGKSDSYFATCERDEEGHCLPKGKPGGGGESAEAEKVEAGPQNLGENQPKKSVSALARAGAEIAKAGMGVAREKLEKLTAQIPEPVRAPVANLWHAVHGVLMAGNNATQALAREAAKNKGLGEKEVEALARTLGAIDLAFQGTMMATAVGAAGVAPAVALAAKGASYAPVASLAYVVGSLAKNPISTLKAAFSLLRKDFPEAIKGAAQFAWGAVRHPLTSQHQEGHKSLDEGDYDPHECAAAVADGLAGAADKEEWLALFSVAFDETRDVAQAVNMADNSVDRPRSGETGEKAQRRTDKRGRTYCVEQGQGRVACPTSAHETPQAASPGKESKKPTSRPEKEEGTGSTTPEKKPKPKEDKPKPPSRPKKEEGASSTTPEKKPAPRAEQGVPADTPVGPSKPEQRKKNVKPPVVKEKKVPPKPRGTNKAPKDAQGRPTKGYAANGMTATFFGDFAEVVATKMGFRSTLPPERRSNKSVKKEGSSLDLEYDHSGELFELKACCVEATEYKAAPKGEELEGKKQYAKIHKANGNMMIAVVDTDAGKAYFYWKPGIETAKLRENNLDEWNYMGEAEFGEKEIEQAREIQRQKREAAARAEQERKQARKEERKKGDKKDLPDWYTKAGPEPVEPKPEKKPTPEGVTPATAPAKPPPKPKPAPRPGKGPKVTSREPAPEGETPATAPTKPPHKPKAPDTTRAAKKPAPATTPISAPQGKPVDDDDVVDIVAEAKPKPITPTVPKVKPSPFQATGRSADKPATEGTEKPTPDQRIAQLVNDVSSSVIIPSQHAAYILDRRVKPDGHLHAEHVDEIRSAIQQLRHWQVEMRQKGERGANASENFDREWRKLANHLSTYGDWVDKIRSVLNAGGIRKQNERDHVNLFIREWDRFFREAGEFLIEQYGSSASEIDWRPSESMPEDWVQSPIRNKPFLTDLYKEVDEFTERLRNMEVILYQFGVGSSLPHIAMEKINRLTPASTAADVAFALRSVHDSIQQTLSNPALVRELTDKGMDLGDFVARWDALRTALTELGAYGRREHPVQEVGTRETAAESVTNLADAVAHIMGLLEGFEAEGPEDPSVLRDISYLGNLNDYLEQFEENPDLATSDMPFYDLARDIDRLLTKIVQGPDHRRVMEQAGINVTQLTALAERASQMARDVYRQQRHLLAMREFIRGLPNAMGDVDQVTYRIDDASQLLYEGMAAFVNLARTGNTPSEKADSLADMADFIEEFARANPEVVARVSNSMGRDLGNTRSVRMYLGKTVDQWPRTIRHYVDNFRKWDSENRPQQEDDILESPIHHGTPENEIMSRFREARASALNDLDRFMRRGGDWGIPLQRIEYFLAQLREPYSRTEDQQRLAASIDHDLEVLFENDLLVRKMREEGIDLTPFMTYWQEMKDAMRAMRARGVGPRRSPGSTTPVEGFEREGPRSRDDLQADLRNLQTFVNQLMGVAGDVQGGHVLQGLEESFMIAVNDIAQGRTPDLNYSTPDMHEVMQTPEIRQAAEEAGIDIDQLDDLWRNVLESYQSVNLQQKPSRILNRMMSGLARGFGRAYPRLKDMLAPDSQLLKTLEDTSRLIQTAMSVDENDQRDMDRMVEAAEGAAALFDRLRGEPDLRKVMETGILRSIMGPSMDEWPNYIYDILDDYYYDDEEDDDILQAPAEPDRQVPDRREVRRLLRLVDDAADGLVTAANDFVEALTVAGLDEYDEPQDAHFADQFLDVLENLIPSITAGLADVDIWEEIAPQTADVIDNHLVRSIINNPKADQLFENIGMGPYLRSLRQALRNLRNSAEDHDRALRERRSGKLEEEDDDTLQAAERYGSNPEQLDREKRDVILQLESFQSALQEAGLADDANALERVIDRLWDAEPDDYAPGSPRDVSNVLSGTEKQIQQLFDNPRAVRALVEGGINLPAFVEDWDNLWRLMRNERINRHQLYDTGLASAKPLHTPEEEEDDDTLQASADNHGRNLYARMVEQAVDDMSDPLYRLWQLMDQDSTTRGTARVFEEMISRLSRFSIYHSDNPSDSVNYFSNPLDEINYLQDIIQRHVLDNPDLVKKAVSAGIDLEGLVDDWATFTGAVLANRREWDDREEYWQQHPELRLSRTEEEEEDDILQAPAEPDRPGARHKPLADLAGEYKATANEQMEALFEPIRELAGIATNYADMEGVDPRLANRARRLANRLRGFYDTVIQLRRGEDRYQLGYPRVSEETGTIFQMLNDRQFGRVLEAVGADEQIRGLIDHLKEMGLSLRRYRVASDLKSHTYDAYVELHRLGTLIRSAGVEGTYPRFKEVMGDSIAELQNAYSEGGDITAALRNVNERVETAFSTPEINGGMSHPVSASRLREMRDRVKSRLTVAIGIAESAERVGILGDDTTESEDDEDDDILQAPAENYPYGDPGEVPPGYPSEPLSDQEMEDLLRQFYDVYMEAAVASGEGPENDEDPQYLSTAAFTTEGIGDYRELYEELRELKDGVMNSVYGGMAAEGGNANANRLLRLWDRVEDALRTRIMQEDEGDEDDDILQASHPDDSPSRRLLYEQNDVYKQLEAMRDALLQVEGMEQVAQRLDSMAHLIHITPPYAGSASQGPYSRYTRPMELLSRFQQFIQREMLDNPQVVRALVEGGINLPAFVEDWHNLWRLMQHERTNRYEMDDAYEHGGPDLRESGKRLRGWRTKAAPLPPEPPGPNVKKPTSEPIPEPPQPKKTPAPKPVKTPKASEVKPAPAAKPAPKSEDTPARQDKAPAVERVGPAPKPPPAPRPEKAPRAPAPKAPPARPVKAPRAGAAEKPESTEAGTPKPAPAAEVPAGRKPKIPAVKPSPFREDDILQAPAEDSPRSSIVGDARRVTGALVDVARALGASPNSDQLAPHRDTVLRILRTLHSTDWENYDYPMRVLSRVHDDLLDVLHDNNVRAVLTDSGYRRVRDAWESLWGSARDEAGSRYNHQEHRRDMRDAAETLSEQLDLLTEMIVNLEEQGVYINSRLADLVGVQDLQEIDNVSHQLPTHASPLRLMRRITPIITRVMNDPGAMRTLVHAGFNSQNFNSAWTEARRLASLLETQGGRDDVQSPARRDDHTRRGVIRDASNFLDLVSDALDLIRKTDDRREFSQQHALLRNAMHALNTADWRGGSNFTQLLAKQAGNIDRVINDARFMQAMKAAGLDVDAFFSAWRRLENQASGATSRMMQQSDKPIPEEDDWRLTDREGGEPGGMAMAPHQPDMFTAYGPAGDSFREELGKFARYVQYIEHGLRGEHEDYELADAMDHLETLRYQMRQAARGDEKYSDIKRWLDDWEAGLNDVLRRKEVRDALAGRDDTDRFMAAWENVKEAGLEMDDQEPRQVTDEEVKEHVGDLLGSLREITQFMDKQGHYSDVFEDESNFLKLVLRDMAEGDPLKVMKEYDAPFQELFGSWSFREELGRYGINPRAVQYAWDNLRQTLADRTRQPRQVDDTTQSLADRGLGQFDERSVEYIHRAHGLIYDAVEVLNGVITEQDMAEFGGDLHDDALRDIRESLSYMANHVLGYIMEFDDHIAQVADAPEIQRRLAEAGDYFSVVNSPEHIALLENLGINWDGIRDAWLNAREAVEAIIRRDSRPAQLMNMASLATSAMYAIVQRMNAQGGMQRERNQIEQMIHDITAMSHEVEDIDPLMNELVTARQALARMFQNSDVRDVAAQADTARTLDRPGDEIVQFIDRIIWEYQQGEEDDDTLQASEQDIRQIRDAVDDGDQHSLAILADALEEEGDPRAYGLRRIVQEGLTPEEGDNGWEWDGLRQELIGDDRLGYETPSEAYLALANAMSISPEQERTWVASGFQDLVDVIRTAGNRIAPVLDGVEYEQFRSHELGQILERLYMYERMANWRWRRARESGSPEDRRIAENSQREVNEAWQSFVSGLPQWNATVNVTVGAVGRLQNEQHIAQVNNFVERMRRLIHWLTTHPFGDSSAGAEQPQQPQQDEDGDEDDEGFLQSPDYGDEDEEDDEEEEEKRELRPGELDEDGGVFEPEHEPDLEEYIWNRFQSQYPSDPDDGIGLETGYLLRDGRAVPMGYHGERAEDHRSAIPSTEAMRRWGWPEEVIRDYENSSRGSALQELLNRSGAVRLHVGQGEINVDSAHPLSRRQLRAIQEYISTAGVESLAYDLPGGKGYLDYATPNEIMRVLENNGVREEDDEDEDEDILQASRDPHETPVTRLYWEVSDTLARMVTVLERYPSARDAAANIRSVRSSLVSGDSISAANLSGLGHEQTYLQEYIFNKPEVIKLLTQEGFDLADFADLWDSFRESLARLWWEHQGRETADFGGQWTGLQIPSSGEEDEDDEDILQAPADDTPPSAEQIRGLREHVVNGIEQLYFFVDEIIELIENGNADHLEDAQNVLDDLHVMVENLEEGMVDQGPAPHPNDLLSEANVLVDYFTSLVNDPGWREVYHDWGGLMHDLRALADARDSLRDSWQRYQGDDFDYELADDDDLWGDEEEDDFLQAPADQEESPEEQRTRVSGGFRELSRLAKRASRTAVDVLDGEELEKVYDLVNLEDILERLYVREYTADRRREQARESGSLEHQQAAEKTQREANELWKELIDNLVHWNEVVEIIASTAGKLDKSRIAPVNQFVEAWQQLHNWMLDHFISNYRDSMTDQDWRPDESMPEDWVMAPEREPTEEERERAVPREPDFTGTDTLGRTWKGGQLVSVVEPETDPEFATLDTGKGRVKIDEVMPEGFRKVLEAMPKGMLRDLSDRGASVFLANPFKEEDIPEEVLSSMQKAGMLEEAEDDMLRLSDTGRQVMRFFDKGLDQLGEMPMPLSRAALEHWREISPTLGPDGQVAVLKHFGIYNDEVGRKLKESSFRNRAFMDVLSRAALNTVNGGSIQQRIRDDRETIAIADRIARLGEEPDTLKQARAARDKAKADFDEFKELPKDEKPLDGYFEKYSELLSEMHRANGKYRDEEVKYKRLTRDIRREARKQLQVPHDQRPNLRFRNQGVRDENMSRLQAAADIVTSWMGARVNAGELDVEETQKKRSGFSAPKKLIRIGKQDNTRSMVHELGHWVEEFAEGAKLAAQDFLAYRTKGEQLRKLRDVYPTSTYRKEEGWKDKFDLMFPQNSPDGVNAWYTGRKYPNGSTEILSMGVQLLYEDPVRFAQRDPEWFAFVVGVLRGTIRDRELPDE